MAKASNLTDFETILVKKYDKRGAAKRDNYESDSLAYRLGVLLKEAPR